MKRSFEWADRYSESTPDGDRCLLIGAVTYHIIGNLKDYLFVH